MKFRTRMSYNNRLLFVYDEMGNVRQTKFVEVSYHGDNYVLAKTAESPFYTVLDVEGNEIQDDINVVHRFNSGLLLTYSTYSKDYLSSDGYKYAVNYNVYQVYNYDTGKFNHLHTMQSENLLEKHEDGALKNKVAKIAVKDFLNRPIYRFNDFVFSEVLDGRFLIAGTLISLSGKSGLAKSFDFELYSGKKMWGVIDIFAKGQFTPAEVACTSAIRLTFKEAEFKLSGLLDVCEPHAEDFSEKSVYNDVSAEFNLYNKWKKKSKWQLAFSAMFAFANN